MCKTCQIRILNERTIGDLKGNFTCAQPGGMSCNDYCIVSQALVPTVRSFKIYDMSYLSDHALIEVDLHISTKQYVNDGSRENSSKLDSGYKWNATDKLLFQKSLEAKFNEKTKFLANNIANQHELDLIDKAITEGLIDVADKVLKRKKHIKKAHKHENKWFNTNLQSMKNELKKLSKKLQTQEDNHFSRGLYFSMKKKF